MDTSRSPAAELTILRTAEEVWRAAADEFARCALDCAARQARFTAALAGGNTPRHFHSMIADDEVSGRLRLPWDKTHVFFGDERVVPPDHADSNYRSAWESLLARVSIPAGNIHRIPTELGAEAAAKQYQEELRQHFHADSVPSFDLIFLGMGADGHTASLFPNSEALREQTRLASTVTTVTARHTRVTLTFPVLNHAARVVFVVTGSDKAPVLREVLSEGASSDAYPAGQVRPVKGTLRWIVDQEAAQMLPRGLGVQRSANAAD